jgi:hypothetical protein
MELFYEGYKRLWSFGNRVNEDIMCNVEGKELIEFCENMTEMLNAKYRKDTEGEYMFIIQLGKSVIQYALMSEAY